MSKQIRPRMQTLDHYSKNAPTSKPTCFKPILYATRILSLNYKFLTLFSAYSKSKHPKTHSKGESSNPTTPKIIQKLTSQNQMTNTLI